MKTTKQEIKEIKKEIKEIREIMKQTNFKNLRILNTENRPNCPYCQAYNIRINLNDAFCRTCGSWSKRVGNKLSKIDEEN